MSDRESSDLPLGYAASRDDWNEAFAHRPMNIGDWNQLTLGEQRRYAAAECKTKGAIYTSHIAANKIEFSVKLPASLSMTGLSRDEAEKLERFLHRKLEEQITSILQLRQMSGGRL